MLTLTRPKLGRIATGVAIGFSELYGIPVWIIRFAWVAAMIASPIAVLIYLLLSISIPNEASVVCALAIEEFDGDISPRERFTRFSHVLVRRLISHGSDYSTITNFVSISLLVIAAILELSKVEGARFYYGHPIIAMMSSQIARVGTALLYIAIAGLFWVRRSSSDFTVSLEMPLSDKFAIDNSDRKMIGGVAAGLSKVIRIEPAYIRALLLLLNILTFGIVGVLYLLVLFFSRRKDKSQNDRGANSIVVARSPHIICDAPRPFALQENENTLHKNNGLLFHFTLALLFLVLAVVRILSEFRLFFFNEPFVQGMVLVLVGIVIVLQEAYLVRSRNDRGTVSISLLAGPSIFFAGVYLLAIALGRVGITFDQNIEIAETVTALSLAYAGVVLLIGAGRRLIFLLALIIGLCAASIGLHFAPLRDIAAIGQFYDFFYPIIFGVIALWSAYEK